MKEESKRVLWKIYKAYYKLGIHHFIGNSGHAIFTGLLYKFNELGYPDELKISIQEMFSLSAISDIRTLRNARNKLSAYLHEECNPDSWIAKYHENGIKEYGTYQINFGYLQEFYSNFTEDLQESSSNKNGLSTKIEGDLSPKSEKNVLLSNTILENKIKDSLSIPVLLQNPKSKNEIKAESDNTDIEFDQQLYDYGKKLVEDIYPFYFTNQMGGPMNNEKNKYLANIGFAWNCYNPELTKQVLKEIAGTIERPSYLLAWASERLDKIMKGEEDYGSGNGKHPKR